MNYITNDEGDIKVRHAKGKEKWLPKHLVENAQLMKNMELTVVPAPVKMEAKITEPNEYDKIVAEAAPAKKSAQTKTK